MTKPPPLGVTARAVVDRVIDGDTVDVLLTQKVRIRMRDCWAPETHGATRVKGEASKLYLRSLLPQGRRVVVDVPTVDADDVGDVLTLGRVVGDIWLAGDSASVNELMVSAGFATREKPKR